VLALASSARIVKGWVAWAEEGQLIEREALTLGRSRRIRISNNHPPLTIRSNKKKAVYKAYWRSFQRMKGS